MELKNRQRFFLSLFFFLSGFCFASWASRIPTIKTNFGYNEAELGTILLFMPVSSLIGLPFSGWLVSRYDSRSEERRVGKECRGGWGRCEGEREKDVRRR